ncbi:LIMC1 protein, partial [Polypterus senegalus]|nr:LIMC1 protein [Polypterus senegalus]
MASPGLDLEESRQQDASPEPAFHEAQQWIEAVTGRRFGEKDFRGGLENGILLCELLNAIKPGIIKKINRLPTPIAGLDNITLFLRGCEDLGLKGSQLFDPGDLQDTSTRANLKSPDCSRKLKNVLITIYWLGKAANCCASYNGPTLNLKEFEGLLSLIRKEAEDLESPKRSIRDSGYVDCWDSERSDSLSPPRHGRDDSFDSLDSFGSRSQQTPSPDVVIRGSSDGRGSDSESDVPHRKMPDVRKDDMLTRRTSCSEPRAAMPFNQYLPNKSNQSAYVPAPLRKKKTEREEYRKSWSTATSPIGGERPFRSVSMIDMRYDEEAILQPHSKARHEHLHNLHNLLREEEDKWQDDLARWKNRRRSASQDLIKKEEERKMMERLMSGEQNLSERRRSIKTYKEIVEEKERRERELHEAYRNAKSPEEAEAVLRRYTQRFTISEAVLEKLEIPKILERSLSVDSDTSPKKEPSAMKYLRQQSLPAPKFTATVQATVEGAPLSQTSPQVSPTRIVSSKAVPLLTPKPYSQPRSSQSGLKSLKVDGMMRVNGEAGNVFERAANENESKPLSTSTSTTKKLIIESLARTDPSSNKSLEAPKGCTSYGTEQNSIMSSTSAVKLHTENFQVKSSVRTKTNILQDTAKINASLEKGETSEDESMGKYHEDFVGPKTTELKTLSCSSDSYRDDDVFEDEAIPSSTEEDMQRTPQRDAHSLVCPVADISSTIMRKDCSQLNSFQNNMYCLSMKEKNQDTAVHDNIQKPVKLAACVIREHKPQQLESLASLETQTAEIIGATDDDNSDILESPINLAKRNEHWSWDPEEERRRQERWQQEQERLLQEKYKKEQEKLKQEWEKAQKEVEEEGRRYHEEERKILEETVTPLTPRSSTLSSPSRSDQPQLPLDPDGTIVRSLADWERKQELLEMQAREKAETCQKNANMQENAHKIFFSSNQETIGKSDAFLKETDSLHTQNIINTNTVVYSPQNCKRPLTDHSQQATSELHFTHDGSWNNKQPLIKEEDDLWKKTASLDRNWNPQSVMDGMKRSGSYENIASNPSKSSPCSSNLQNQSPNSRSVSGKKLCSSCGHPLGKGAAMIIETLSLYFHIHCFKCGICKGQLGDTTTGTDVRIRNGLLNCQDCYIRSRTTGQPTTL